MAYQQQNNNRRDWRPNSNKYNNNQQPQKPRNQTMIIPIASSAFAKFRGDPVDVNMDDVIDCLKYLEEVKAFEKLTQNISMDRSLIDPEKKGTIAIGFINSYDVESNSMSVTVYGGAVNYVERLGEDSGIVIMPVVILDRDSNFKSFNMFSLVKA